MSARDLSMALISGWEAEVQELYDLVRSVSERGDSLGPYVALLDGMLDDLRAMRRRHAPTWVDTHGWQTPATWGSDDGQA